MIEIWTKDCPNCGKELLPGGGHGDKCYFRYRYCSNCDEFIYWQSIGLDDIQKKNVQDMMRHKIKEQEPAP